MKKNDPKIKNSYKYNFVKSKMNEIEEKIKKVRMSVECWKSQRELLKRTMSSNPIFDFEFELSAKRTLEKAYVVIIEEGIELLSTLEIEKSNLTIELSKIE